MSDIPIDLIREFLVRVPSEDLARCRCVCKSWKGLIDGVAFIKSNLHRQMGGNKLIIFSNRNSSRNIYSIPVNSLYNHPTCETKIEPKTVTLKVMPRVHSFPIPSCDGLVLERIDNSWALSNLLTKECLKLPLYHSVINTPKKVSQISTGLGYDVVTNDYKVALIFSHFEYSIGTIIYSLKSGVWHKIEHYPNVAHVPGPHHGVFVNGEIYWITSTNQKWFQWDVEGLIALDLHTEKYRQIPLPPLSKQPPGYHLSVLNDCLIFSQGYDAWILKQNGVDEIWTKFLSLQHGFKFDHHTRLLAYDNSREEVLIQYKDEGFLWYHLPTRCAKKVTLKGLGMSFSSQVISSSLIRLNGSSRKETWNRPRKRLKLKLTTSDVPVRPDVPSGLMH